MNFRINFLDSKKNYIGSLLGSVLNGICPQFCIFVVSLTPGIVFVALVNYLKNHDFFMNLLLVFSITPMDTLTFTPSPFMHIPPRGCLSPAPPVHLSLANGDRHHPSHHTDHLSFSAGQWAQ